MSFGLGATAMWGPHYFGGSSIADAGPECAVRRRGNENGGVRGIVDYRQHKPDPTGRIDLSWHIS